MPGQTIGTVNVQVGSQVNPKVTTVSYGSRSLKSLTDVSLESHANGASLIYNSITDSFTLGQPTAVVTAIDAGRF